MMKRSMRASKDILEDEEDENWGRERDTSVKVRAARILGPKEHLSQSPEIPSENNHACKKRLRKVIDVDDLDPPIDTKIVRGSSEANPFQSFSFQQNPRKKADRGFSLKSPPSEAKSVSKKEPPPRIVSERAYDGSQPWLEPVVMGDDGKRSRRRKFTVAVSSDDDDEYDPTLDLPPRKSTFETNNMKQPPQSSSGRNGVHNASSSGAGDVVIDLGDNAAADDEAIAELLQKDELVDAGFEKEGNHSNEEAEGSDELDLIFSTLQKCEKVAKTLRQDLHSTSVLEDRYAEVDPSTAKIVTQAEVCAACGITATDTAQFLKPYQLVGVNFMLLLNRKNVGGAILADEMGLGKTVQAVAFLALLRHLDGDPGPHLIVCPASVLDNWQRELRKWCPAFKVVLFHGNERAALIREFKDQRKAGNELPFNVMLTCYTLFERRSAQQKDDRGFMRKWKWSCVLMDEAHFLKDRDSLRTTRLRDLAQKAKQRVMLTGTPLQNDLQELWSLLEFLLPNIFDTGKADLSKLLGTRNSTATVLLEDGELINQMKAILGPFVLRRLKTDVMQQLVPKIHKVECIAMVPDQALAYQDSVVEYRTMTAAARAARTDSGPAAKEVSVPKRQIQNIFTQLRKVANHPLLIRRLYSDRDVEILAAKLHAREVFGNQCTEERVKDELKGYNDFTLYQLCIQNGLSGAGFGAKLNVEHPLASAKCQVLARLLPELKESGHRPLIFSQWTQMLDILEWACDVLGLSYVRLDGSTQVRERQEIVDLYNNDSSIFIFLLSTRAGGQGLNLTGADTVIIHDVDFNPQMDRQAEDRCHRIGQTKPVTVYRLVTKGSVDESIYNIAQRKLVLDAALLESGGAMSKENGEHADGDAQTMEEILSAILAAVPS